MRRESGFTLIEIMVVLAIMAVLMGGVAFIITAGQKAGKKTETQSLINQVVAALEMAKSPDNLGEYPPTDTRELRLGSKKIGKTLGISDEKCMGIETVTLLLFMAELDLGERIEQKYLINADIDQIEANADFLVHKKQDLYELRDAWNQPLVYFHHRDYDKYLAEPMETVDEVGNPVYVKPIKDPTTDIFYKLESYQLFSIGPDGEAGTEDDIRNF